MRSSTYVILLFTLALVRDIKNSLFGLIFIHCRHRYFLIKEHNSIIMRVQISVVENSAAF